MAGRRWQEFPGRPDRAVAQALRTRGEFLRPFDVQWRQDDGPPPLAASVDAVARTITVTGGVPIYRIFGTIQSVTMEGHAGIAYPVTMGQTITVRDLAGQELAVVIPADGLAPVITSPLSAGFAWGEPFTYQITADNAPTDFGAADLPAGLSVDAAGLISGTMSDPVIPWLGYWDLTTAAGVQVVTATGAGPFTYFGARPPASFDADESALRFDPAEGTEWMGAEGITTATATAITIGMQVRNLELAAALAVLEVGPAFDSVEIGVSGNASATYFNVVTSPAGDQAFPAAPVLADGAWHWVVMTVDFTTKAVALYVDGALYATMISVYAHGSISVGSAFIHCWNNQKALVKQVFCALAVLPPAIIARLSAGEQPDAAGRMTGDAGPFNVSISASNAAGTDAETLVLSEAGRWLNIKLSQPADGNPPRVSCKFTVSGMASPFSVTVDPDWTLAACSPDPGASVEVVPVDSHTVLVRVLVQAPATIEILGGIVTAFSGVTTDTFHAVWFDGDPEPAPALSGVIIYPPTYANACAVDQQRLSIAIGSEWAISTASGVGRLNPNDLTADDGHVLVGAQYGAPYEAWRVFDGSDSTTWFPYSTGTDPTVAWMGYDFQSPVSIRWYDILGVGIHWPSAWRLDSSDDGVAWTARHTSDTLGAGQSRVMVELSVSARYWRIVRVHAGNLTDTFNTEVATLAMYGVRT